MPRGRKPKVMPYEQAVQSLPSEIGKMSIEAAKLRDQAQRLQIEAMRLEDEHFANVRPVSCDSCMHARKGPDGEWRDRGWSSANCCSCARPGFSQWQLRRGFTLQPV